MEQLEKGKISTSQLILLTMGLLFASQQILASIFAITIKDGWLAVLPALLEGLALIIIIGALVHKFPHKNLIAINDLVFGSFFGKIVSLLYLCFFLSIISFNLMYMGTFMLFLMPETPNWVFILFFIGLSTSAVRNGIEVTARTASILTLIFLVEIPFTIILLINKINFQELLPILNIPLIDFAKTSHLVYSATFGEAIVLLMLVPALNNAKDIKKSFLWAFIIFTPLLISIIVANITVLGESAAVFTYPSLQVVRTINIRNIIIRMDILVVLGELSMNFIRITIYHYCLTLGTAQIFKMKTYTPIIIPLGIMAIILSFSLFKNTLEYRSFMTNIFPLYSFPFEGGLLILTLVVAYLRPSLKK